MINYFSKKKKKKKKTQPEKPFCLFIFSNQSALIDKSNKQRTSRIKRINFFFSKAKNNNNAFFFQLLLLLNENFASFGTVNGRESDGSDSKNKCLKKSKKNKMTTKPLKVQHIFTICSQLTIWISIFKTFQSSKKERKKVVKSVFKTSTFLSFPY